MFAYLAGITERIQFATGVLVLPQRQTALVARQAADVDLLSGGRLRLGVGSAGTTSNTRPSDRTSVPAARDRRSRSSFCAGCSRNPSSNSRGASTASTEPHWCRSQPGSIPIWLGGSSEPHSIGQPVSLTASSSLVAPSARAVESWQRVLRERVLATGRSIEDFGADYLVRPQDGGVERDSRRDRRVARGGPERQAPTVSVVTMGLGMTSADSHIDYLA
jgi:alkanesulfonate monooxygenase SsuD/methylene tetrahydromethanopterin reductase-like flavin-dependent oxidoreductase (luciferase family)